MAAAAQSATRQQLDELDSLLEKMLARPGGAPTEASPPVPSPVPEPSPLAQKLAGLMSAPPVPPQFPTPSVAYGVPPAVAFAASPMTVAPPAPAPPPPPAPTRKPGWTIELNPRETSSVIADRGHNTPVPSTAAAAALKLTAIERPAPRSTATSRPAKQVVPLTLRPFAWLNSAYDGFMNSVVPLGWLFTGQSARALMGYSGAAMLVASIIWAGMLWAGWSW